MIEDIAKEMWRPNKMSRICNLMNIVNYVYMADYENDGLSSFIASKIRVNWFEQLFVLDQCVCLTCVSFILLHMGKFDSSYKCGLYYQCRHLRDCEIRLVC